MTSGEQATGIGHDVKGGGPRLVIVSSSPVTVLDGGRFALSQKFVTGVEAYQREWPGPIEVIAPPRDGVPGMDVLEATAADLPFRLSVQPVPSPEVEESLRGAAMVLLMLGPEHVPLASMCQSLGVPCVFTTEYSLETRRGIIAAEVANPLKRAAKMALEQLRERRARQAVAVASGVQSNGTPTFEAYRGLNPQTMLFFDTRATEDMLATEADLEKRSLERETSGVLRLAYTGRLVEMKGVSDLIEVADLLRHERPFTLSIYGDGHLRGSLEREIQTRGLEQHVFLHEPLDFADLMTRVRETVDVFVCCHRQGDPSCTYLETMACGVPIAGYNNEAFGGVNARSSAGWPVGMYPRLLARQLAGLTGDMIDAHSRLALGFARQHTFEREFTRRMEHARRLAGVTLPT